THFTEAQNCEKGCGKITKVEPTKIKGIKPNRALLVFKFQGPDGKPAKSHIKVVVDGKDTLYPKIDLTGTAKVTTKPGSHALKFIANYWYSVKMEQVSVKSETTYNFFVRFEPKEIGAVKSKEKD
ncbi:MAG TPA: hypothetical protein VF411_02760, partial [Bacteroidia bacterium]